MPRASPRKKAAVNYNEDDGAKPKANGAATKTAAAPQKRKVEPAEEVAAVPVSNKKRKVGKAKEGDAMPLAERTSTASLKKAMYIGAHVSAAGGRLYCA